MAALQDITTQLENMSIYSEQTRYAVDFILAKNGGACAIIGEQCVVGITNMEKNIIQHILDILENVKGMESGNWSWSLFGGWGWGWILEKVIYFIVILICCCVLIQCLPLCCSYCATYLTPKRILIHDTNVKKSLIPSCSWTRESLDQLLPLQVLFLMLHVLLMTSVVFFFQLAISIHILILDKFSSTTNVLFLVLSVVKTLT